MENRLTVRKRKREGERDSEKGNEKEKTTKIIICGWGRGGYSDSEWKKERRRERKKERSRERKKERRREQPDERKKGKREWK